MIVLIVIAVLVVVGFGGLGAYALVASGQTREFDKDE